DKEPPPIEQVAVPEITNQMDQGDVTTLLETAGLKLDNQGGEASADVEEGNATRWEPEVGTMVDEGSAVKVWFSTGPSEITVPDVTGMEQNAARDRLVAAGLDASNFSVQTENVPDMAEGRVARTEPAGGESVAPDAEITIIVASGNVEVPNFVGKQFEEAT